MKLKLPWTVFENALVPIVAVTLFLCGAARTFAQARPDSLPATNTVSQPVRWHTIQVKPRPNFPMIHFYDKLNPVWWLKNIDDPVPPKWYKPDDRHRKLKWSFRNPLHNFMFYVIGVADKTFYRSGRFPERVSDPRGGWDFDATRYKIIWLPFVSYHRQKFDFYFGWRDRGNFGIKININPHKNDKPKPEPMVATVVPGRSKVTDQQAQLSSDAGTTSSPSKASSIKPPSSRE